MWWGMYVKCNMYSRKRERLCPGHGCGASMGPGTRAGKEDEEGARGERGGCSIRGHGDGTGRDRGGARNRCGRAGCGGGACTVDAAATARERGDGESVSRQHKDRIRHSNAAGRAGAGRDDSEQMRARTIRIRNLDVRGGRGDRGAGAGGERQIFDVLDMREEVWEMQSRPGVVASALGRRAGSRASAARERGAWKRYGYVRASPRAPPSASVEARRGAFGGRRGRERRREGWQERERHITGETCSITADRRVRSATLMGPG